MKRVTIYQF
jgi:hypothetical protein